MKAVCGLGFEGKGQQALSKRKRPWLSSLEKSAWITRWWALKMRRTVLNSSWRALASLGRGCHLLQERERGLYTFFSLALDQPKGLQF